jgi:xanthine dehydrogenase accessory factor
MLVSKDNCRGSIGGGNLEFTAMHRARELLTDAPASGYELQLFGLGPALNQCCGGSVQVLFEVFSSPTPKWLEHYITCLEQGRNAVLVTHLGDEIDKLVLNENSAGDNQFPAEVDSAAIELINKPAAMVFINEPQQCWLETVQQYEPELFLFGAGHVGKAMIRALEPLPFNITWIDSREYEFPEYVPSSVRQRVSAEPLGDAASAPPGSLYLVMTHSHELDEDLCHAILQRGDFAWLGLIGSTSKRRRFVSRLAKRGIGEDLLNRLVCPIGISSIKGKQPATIAVAVAAQLLSEFHHHAG